MKLLFSQKTDRGLVRENNEDYFGAAGPFDGEPESKGSLFVLADGLGGLEDGEIASREAVDRLIGLFRGLGPNPFEDWLLESFHAVNKHISRLNRTRSKGSMATTLTACHFYGANLKIAHVGDCRVYRLRKGRYDCLTKDHASGRQSLTRAIGIEATVQVDLYLSQVEDGDVYCSASDGLYGEIGESDMILALQIEDPEKSASRLIQLSLERGGFDNATVQVIRIKS